MGTEVLYISPKWHVNKNTLARMAVVLTSAPELTLISSSPVHYSRYFASAGLMIPKAAMLPPGMATEESE